jgi:DNA-binding Lrp family transcriptional regulator
MFDEADLKIVSALRRIGKSSLPGIRAETGIAESTLSYRVKKLKQAGVIVGSFFAIPASAYGALSFEVLLQIKMRTGQIDTKVQEFACRHPCVTASVKLFSSLAYILEAVVDSHAEVRTLCDDLKTAFADELLKVSFVLHLRVLPKARFSLLG